MSRLVPAVPTPDGNFLLYQTEDGRTRLEVRFEAETAWLTQAQMAELFQTTVPNVSMHIRNIFAERELPPGSVVKESLTTAADGKNYAVKFYNLDDFLRLSGRKLLTHAGKISHEQAVEKAELEFETFHRSQLAEPSQVERDFDAAVKDLTKSPAPGRKREKS